MQYLQEAVEAGLCLIILFDPRELLSGRGTDFIDINKTIEELEETKDSYISNTEWEGLPKYDMTPR